MTLSAESLWPALEPWSGASRWWVGLSGGLDSCLLLSLLAELRDAGEHPLPSLAAIHVDHRLHPDSAHWVAHCAALCEALSVPLETEVVEVDPAGEGPEAAAREARYRAFVSCVADGELLLLAHHRDDQVETFFLRLMRGAGSRGLSGMPASRELDGGQLFRPLLPYTRSELEACAHDRGLTWVEDPSNAALDADRNFLRQVLLPQLATRWPGYRQSVIASMEALADAEQALASGDEVRLATAREVAFGEACLDLKRLGAESAAEQARLLRRWLESEGVAVPTRSRLLEFSRQLEVAGEDSQPALELEQGSLRRYRQRVFLVPQPPTLPAEQRLEPQQPVELPGLGRLWVEASESGLRLPVDGGWQLRWRGGGERCQPLGRGHSQALKQLLQERGVPPWVRERLPLLYDGDAIAAVADLWVCEGFQASATEAAWSVCWSPSRAVLD